MTGNIDRQWWEQNAHSLKEARTVRNLSREKLSLLCGLHPNTIGAVESGKQDISCMSEFLILFALGCEAIVLEEDRTLFKLVEKETNYSLHCLLGRPKPFYISIIGQVIRKQRYMKGLNLEDVAEQCGIHRNTLWNIEHGLVIAKNTHLEIIYRALGVTKIQAVDRGIIIE